jgi:homeobox protein Nkx-6.3
MESNLQGTFLLNNTPLAQFSEMKAPVCQYSVQNSFYKLSPPGLGPQLAAGTPHGITDILSRPVATPNSGLLSSYPHVAGFGGLGSQGVYYGPQMGNFSKSGSEYTTRSRNCWADTSQDWRGGRPCSNSEYRGGLPQPGQSERRQEAGRASHSHKR